MKNHTPRTQDVINHIADNPYNLQPIFDHARRLEIELNAAKERECSQQLETELAALRADKIRLDALDAILAENAYRARLGWRWNPEGPDSEFKLYLSQDGKMRSVRQALDVMLAARKEGSK